MKTIGAASREDMAPVAAAAWPLEGCPSCGATELYPVPAGDSVNLLCPSCLSCWHEEVGSVTQVDPGLCPGCQFELICQEHRLGASPGR